MMLVKFKLGDGSQIRFCEDIWLGNLPLKQHYPNLYNVVRKKEAMVSEILNSVPLNVSFRRTIIGIKLLEWNHLVARIANVNFQLGRDIATWSLNKNGSYSVSSMYKFLTNTGTNFPKQIWWVKVPLKTKVFMWFLKRGVILTKDNLAKRNWEGSKLCSFCSGHETNEII